MTYNIHSCRGFDKKISPERIARVIAGYEPDIVALQEVDVGKLRSGGIDQAREIAGFLKMFCHFHPSLNIEEEFYGNAVLSRFSLQMVKADRLPGIKRKPGLEPRSAIWVKIDVEGIRVNFINTHLGLRRPERCRQADLLTGSRWLANRECDCPVILGGDLNSQPRSYVYRRFQRLLRDAQWRIKGEREKPTWPSRLPFNRIDYLFVSDGIEVKSVQVPRTGLTRTASDHLPLIADIIVHKR
ncbi:MAG: endonuclease/exonuclease/phosphatase family protein [Thermodesulfobacteriota bacterium]